MRHNRTCTAQTSVMPARYALVSIFGVAVVCFRVITVMPFECLNRHIVHRMVQYGVTVGSASPSGRRNNYDLYVAPWMVVALVLGTIGIRIDRFDARWAVRLYIPTLRGRRYRTI